MSYRRTHATYARRYPVSPQNRYIAQAGAYKATETPEKKWLDTGILGNFTVAGAVIPSFNLVPQGVTPVTRIGQQIMIKSIHLHTIVSMQGVDDANAATAEEGMQCRMIIYIDKQANGATIAVGDLLASAETVGFNQLSNRDRFVVLKDKFVAFSPQAITWTGVPDTFIKGDVIRTWNYHKKLNLPVEFSGSTGAITEVRSMNIGMLLIATSETVAVGSLYGTARIRFTDC